MARSRLFYLVSISVFVGMLAVLSMVPAFLLFLLSLFEWSFSAAVSSPFVGMANYVRLFSDERFLNSVLVTIKFIVIPVPIQIALGLFLALLLNRELKGSNIIRSVFLIPMVIPPIIVGLCFRILYHPKLGPMSYYLSLVGIRAPAWFTHTNTAVAAIVIAVVWEWIPFCMLIFLAALESFPKDPYEAAIVDGASWVQMFWYITLPFLKPVMYVVLVFRIIESLAIFPIIFITTGGGPGSATEPTNFYAYVTAFQYLEMSYGATMLIIFFAILLTFAIYFLTRVTKAIGA